MPNASENMKVTLSAAELQVEAGQAAELIISVKNLSEVVDQYQLEVQDVDPRWVEILVGSVSLFPHDEDNLRLILKPPRSSEARAGEHSFKVLIRSREFPTEAYSATLILKIAAFSGFEARLSPERATARGRCTFELELTNAGNCPLTFDLTATDSEQACLLEFRPAQVELEPGKSVSVPLGAEPKQKPKVGGSKTYSITVVAAPRGFEPRTLACQLTYQPPIPKWVPVAAVVGVLAAAAVIASLMRSPPVVQTFAVSPETIKPGEQATLTWEVSGGGRVTITPQPGENLKAEGSVELSPAQTTVYKLIAKKGWARPVEKEIKLVVAAELRQFEAVAGSQSGAQVEVPQGERVLLRWEVAGVEKVNITDLGTRPAKGEETVSAAQTTDYVLRAEGGEVEGHVLVAVTEAPKIMSFMPQPAQINRGQPTTLIWEVTGVEAVKISGLGTVPASGSRVVRPTKSSEYILTASNSAGTRQLSTYVEVSEPPGSVASALVGKPATEIPFIKKFEAYPTKVLIVREDTTLSWEVYGADRVVIEPGVGEVDPSKGRVKKSFKLPGTETFTLTATNSLGKSTAKIKVEAVMIK